MNPEPPLYDDFPAWERAVARAMRQRVLEMPDPAEFAYEIPAAAAEALERCYSAQGGIKTQSNRDAAVLFPWGLCEARGRFLTGFGCRVRRALIGDTQ